MYNLRRPECYKKKSRPVFTLFTTNPTDIEHGPRVKNSANKRPINDTL